jgi:CRISPR-associated protein Csx14
MNHPAPSLSVNVDVTNPGQFFACCGLLELAHRLWPGAAGWFEDGQFSVAPLGTGDSTLQAMLGALIECDVRTVNVSDPKTDPIELGKPIGLRLDWWLRFDGTTNLFKTWAANATSQQMFSKWREPLKACLKDIEQRPERLFEPTSRVQGSYGFDRELGWDALAVGFSLNEHAEYRKLPTHPAVELLGALGLQRFFPDFHEKKQAVRYATWHPPLTPPVSRLATVGALSVATSQRFRTRFVYRGSFKGLDKATIIQGEPTNER